MTAEASNNAVYNEGINHIREQMMEGAGLADPLAETGLFPAAARQMFRVGEETGTLDKQLKTAAVFYHRELELKVKHFTSLFEPVIIIFMGVIVGFVAVALVSAMYGIYQPGQGGRDLHLLWASSFHHFWPSTKSFPTIDPKCTGEINAFS